MPRGPCAQQPRQIISNWQPALLPLAAWRYLNQPPFHLFEMLSAAAPPAAARGSRIPGRSPISTDRPRPSASAARTANNSQVAGPGVRCRVLPGFVGRGRDRLPSMLLNRCNSLRTRAGTGAHEAANEQRCQRQRRAEQTPRGDWRWGPVLNPLETWIARLPRPPHTNDPELAAWRWLCRYTPPLRCASPAGPKKIQASAAAGK